MKKHQAKSLISKYLTSETTPEERILLEQWFLKDLKESEYVPNSQKIEEADARITARLMSHIGLQNSEAKITKIWPRIAIVAAMLTVILGIFFFSVKKYQEQQIANALHRIVPGSRKATLTLANGKSVVLDNANGFIAKQGTSLVNRASNGEIVYQKANNNETLNPEISYNVVTIPRGAVNQVIILPDGTKAWINSASSLRYPAAFNGNDRKVELTGEAYFEVAHDPAKPFRVISNNQMVEVLGTHFNINAYDDEPGVKTTLLKGAVKVTAFGKEKLLTPGQQALMKDKAITLNTVDENEVVAWKNGYFEFSNTDIQSAMRQISRWYDVEIQCDGHINDETLTGRISRSKSITDVLQMFRQSKNIHITISGRRIMVKD